MGAGSGGEIMDAELEYFINRSTGALQKLVQNYENGDFYIRYFTNFGEQHEIKVKVSLTDY